MNTLTNRMKRTFILPGLFGVNNEPTHRALTLEPGQSGQVDPEHWAGVTKGNKVIESLLGTRHLVLSRGTKEVTVDPEELANPKQPTAPEDLKEKDDRVKVESKVELKEIELKNDEPASTSGKKKT